jgi:DNA repair exonuclease SbcCD nuclease subunit
MKIVISADHHFHMYTQFAKPVGSGMNSRFFEMLVVEDFLHEWMKQEGIQVHIRAGDLFERKSTFDAVVFSEVVKRIVNNRRAGIQEIILKGNHDQAAGGARHSLEALKHVDLAEVVADGPAQYEFDGVVFHFVPYDDNADTLRAQLETLFPVAEKQNVLIAHLAVEGAKTGSEYLVPGTVQLEDLKPERWDFIFLGHIHEPQCVEGNTHYVGSLFQRNFSDSGSQRSVIVFDTSTGFWERKPMPGPQFVTKHISGPDDIGEPVPGIYYKLFVPPTMPLTAVNQAYEHALGFFTEFSAAEGSPAGGDAPRISAGLQKWEDIADAYVDQIKPKQLKAATLKKLGRTIIGVRG